MTSLPHSQSARPGTAARRWRAGLFACVCALAFAFANTPVWAQATGREQVLADLAKGQADLARALAQHGENHADAYLAMFSVGLNLGKLERYLEARDIYIRAVKSAEATHGPEHRMVAAMHNNLAGAYDDLEQYDLARQHYLKAFEVFAKTIGSRNEFTLRALNSLGNMFLRLDDYERAEKTFEFALPRRREVHGADSEKALRTQAALATAKALRGDYAGANELLKGVVDAYRRTLGATDDDTLNAMLDTANTFQAMGDYASAEELTRRALAAIQGKYGESDLRTLKAGATMAQIHAARGQHAQALALNEHVFNTRKRLLGERDRSTLSAQSALASSLIALGRTREALTMFEQVAQARERAHGPDDVLTLSARLDFAGAQVTLGQYGQAGPEQARVAEAARKRWGMKNPFTLNAIAELSNTLYHAGNIEYSRELLEMVVQGRTELLGKDHRDTLAAQHNLALRQIKLRQFASARQSLQAAIGSIESTAPAHPALADLPYYQRTLGELLAETGERAAAVGMYRRGLALVERLLGADHPLAGGISVYLAHAVSDPSERLALYTRALAVGRASASSDTIWRAADGLREVYAKLGNREAAILHGKLAINTLQAARDSLNTVSRGLQEQYLTDKRPVYTRTADLLIAEGRLAEAQQVMALIKQAEYYDFVRRNEGAAEAAKAQLGLNTQEATWMARYQSVSDRLVETARRRSELEAKATTGTLAPEERAELGKAADDLAAARQAFLAASRQIAEEARRQAASGQAPALNATTMRAVGAMRDDLRQLGHGAVLVNYLVAQEKTWILITTPQLQLAREAPVGAVALNRRIEALRSALRSPTGDALTPAKDLYRWLLAPIERDLQQAGARTVMLGLDGALRYVPFAVLHDGQSWAVEKWRFVVFTEAAKSRIKDLPQANWTLTGLGLTKAVAGFSALPAVREELAGIVRGKGAGDAGVLDGEAVFDEAFTLNRMRSVLAAPTPVLHIASHFKFTPGTEADSYLVMGDGGKLSLQQIREDDLRFNVDLLTLSACETAVGDNARGTEVEGLGALAQEQGAKAVLATLWPVADASTGLFMRELYRLRAAEKLTKAEAIARVQLGFAQGRYTAAQAGGEQRGARAQGASTVPAAAGNKAYTHPFYWAPFILMGNWL